MKVKEEKEVLDRTEAVEEKKVDLCAIPKQFVLEKLNELYNANKQLFDEYNLFIQVLNSHVQVTDQDSTKTVDTE